MALADLELLLEDDEKFEEEEDSGVQDDLTEALTLLEDCRELILVLLDPNLWEAKYVTKYVKREIEKLEAEILAFTDQWQFPEKGKEEVKQ